MLAGWHDLMEHVEFVGDELRTPRAAGQDIWPRGCVNAQGQRSTAVVKFTFHFYHFHPRSAEASGIFTTGQILFYNIRKENLKFSFG